MAEENNLDDFFANKDKCKKKSTKSSLTPDDIEQLIEKKTKGKKTLKTKRKDEVTSEASNVKRVEGGDDEWKEYEEEIVKDYSGLKILSLVPGSKNGVDQECSENQSGDEESGDKKDSQQGPWKPVAAPEVLSDPEPEAVAVVVEAPKTGKYVPPAFRQSQTASRPPVASVDKPSGKYVPPALRHSQGLPSRLSNKKKVAPDVKNVDDFPSLSAATIIEQSKVTQDFEKVKGGAKQTGNPLNASTKIYTNNKFGALDNGDS